MAAECICAIPLALYFEVKCMLTCRYTCILYVGFMLVKGRCAGWFLFSPRSNPCPPALCPGKLFSRYRPGSFSLWLVLRSVQRESSAENSSQGGGGGYEVFTPFHTLCVTLMTPWIGSVLCGTGYTFTPPGLEKVPGPLHCESFCFLNLAQTL